MKSMELVFNQEAGTVTMSIEDFMKMSKGNGPQLATMGVDAKDINIEELVSDFLASLGVPRNGLGFGYLRTAIQICLKDPDSLNAITQKLYPQIARLNNTTSTRAERAIRHAIEVTFSRGNTDALDKMFGYSVSSNSGKATNSEFIATVYDKIRLALKKGGISFNDQENG